MDLSKLRYCFLWVAFCFVLQCSDKSSNPDTAKHYPFDQEVEVSAGVTIVFENDELTLTFEGVNFDERCVDADVCDKAGMAEVRLRAKAANSPEQRIDLGIKSQSSPEAVNILRVDTLGYAFELLELTLGADSIGVTAAQDEYVATIRVSKTIARKKFTGSLILRAPSGAELAMSREQQMLSARAIGDTLIMEVRFNQGCRQSYFDLFFDPSMSQIDTLVGARLWLRQFAGADSCTSQQVTRTLRFDISLIKAAYLQQFGSWECVRLVIQPAANGQLLGQIIEAIYGRCGTYSHLPVLNVPSQFILKALWTDTLKVSASDLDGDQLWLWAQRLPENSQFVDNHDGTGIFRMTPTIFQRGIHTVTFFAFDGRFYDSARVSIVVTRPDASLNHPPIIFDTLRQFCQEREMTVVEVLGFDEDRDTLRFSGGVLPANATLEDRRNGTARLTFQPSFFQAGLQACPIIVSDGYLADTGVILFSVENVNRPPVFSKLEIGRIVKQTSLLSSLIEVSDPDNEVVTLTAGGLPDNAAIETISLNRYRFSFQPDTTQIGIYQIPLSISDGIATVTGELAVQVVDEYNVIYFDPVDSLTMTEGEKLTIDVHAYSQLGIRELSISNLDTLRNVSFSNRGNGVGKLTMSPTFVSAGNYRILVVAKDRLEEQSIVINVRVLEAGDQPPRFAPDTLQFTIAEGYGISQCVMSVDLDMESPSYFPIHLAEGASFGLNGSCQRFVFQSTDGIAGVFVSQIGTSDPDIPEVVDTLTILVTVKPIIHNSGPLMPGGIGTYWVNEYGFEGTVRTVDSVAIIDSTRVEGQLWWILSKPLTPFGKKFCVKQDTLIISNITGTAELKFAPNAVPKLSVTPAGAFARTHSFVKWTLGGTPNNPPRRIYYYEFAEGVGFVFGAHEEFTKSSYSILRYHVAD